MNSIESVASDCLIDDRELKEMGIIDTGPHGKQLMANILLVLFYFHLGHFRNSSKKPLTG